MTDSIIAFLPCRKGSERVISKNTKDFAGISGGLLTVKLKQLIACEAISEIVVSTDDPVVVSISEEFKRKSVKPIRVDKRPEYLALSTTKIGDLIRYIPTLFPKGDQAHLLWVHVTEPFADSSVYQSAIDNYSKFVSAGHFDSLLSVTPIQTFIWNEKGPYNYDGDIDRWPRTQDIDRLFEINCAFFMIQIELMKKLEDRVGINPYFMELSFPADVDIDTDSDFEMAEKLWKAFSGSLVM